MRRSSLLIIGLFVLLVLASGCGLKSPKLPDPPEEPGPIPLDFSRTINYSQGDWLIDTSGESPVITQSETVDVITWMVFEDLELPANFAFEAEITVLDGSNSQRPYLGLIINMPHDQFTRRLPNGYRIAFRRAHSRYEIDRRAQQAPTSTILAEHHFNWAEEPWEYGVDDWRHFRVERKGSTIDVFLNGELIMSAENTDYLGGTLGFWTDGTAAIFRNIKLERL